MITECMLYSFQDVLAGNIPIDFLNSIDLI
jgi:hypothetical protein